MGLLSFKKKKAAEPSGTPHSGWLGPAVDTSAALSDRKNKWTPGRRKATTAPSTGEMHVDANPPVEHPPVAPSSAVLNSLSVMALDDVEVMTFESQRALMDQREEIRKKLFESQTSPNSLNLLGSASGDPEDNVDDFLSTMEKSSALFHRSRTYGSASTPRVAHEASKDTVLQKVQSSPTSSPSDRFSLPLEAVSRSWSGGGASLQKISEEPVDYGTPHGHVSDRRDVRRGAYAGPVSVDVSYTDSELASIATAPPRQPAVLEIVTPSPASHNASYLTGTESTNSAIRLLQGTVPTNADLQVTPHVTLSVTSPLVSTADDIDAYVDPEAVETSFTGSLTPARRGITIPFYGKLMAAASPDVMASTSVVVSPAMSTYNSHDTSMQSGVAPMDERETDHELEDFLNAGKSPLKGMPEDERLEYQKDEMVAPPMSRELSNESVQTPEVIVQNDDGEDMEPKEEEQSDNPNAIVREQTSHSMGTTSGATSTSYTTSYGDTTRTSSAVVPELARSILLAAFQCGSGALDKASKTVNSCGNVIPSSVVPTMNATTNADGATSRTVDGTDLPLHTMVEPSSPRAKRRVYLDEASTVRFLRRITNNGFVLLYLQPTSDDYLISEADVPTDDWKGNTVTMMVQKGCISAVPTSTGGSDTMDVNVEAPRLEWITVTGGTVSDATTTSVYLLDIQSILTNDDEKEDEDMCFFTITDGAGDVHIFEAATLEERNRIVHGLKTIIARWSFHLIAGDITATSELYANHASSMNLDVDMPSLPNPSQTMNLVSHMLLDAGA